MRYRFTHLLLALCATLILFACGEDEKAAEKPKAVKKTARKEKVDKAKLQKEKEEKRQALVKEELAAFNDHKFAFDASGLEEKDKIFLRHMLQAAEIVEDLNMLQVHNRNLHFAKEVEKTGTDDDKKLYHRYQLPWCITSEDPLCNALKTFPPKRIGYDAWPESMTDEEFEKIKKAPEAKNLLSPFTVVRRAGTDKWIAVPYTKDTVLGPRMRALSASLKAAAKYADTPSLAKFLESRAEAFIADDPFPYDESDYDWIALDGKWEVTCGPYEVYKNPRQIKARFEMFVGLVNKEVTAQLSKFRKDLQTMENELAALVGEEIYKSRKIDPRVSIRAIDVIMASGDGRGQQGATVAFHLPNRGKSVDEGLYKKVMLVNHAKAFEPVYRARAALILDETQKDMVSGMTDILNVTFHEFAHGFGAYKELKIRDKAGKETTVGGALKDLSSLFEEAKADVTALWFIEQSLKKGWINQSEAEQRYTSGVMHAIGLMQYPLRGVYPRMCALQLGHYLDSGALIYNRETGRLKIDYEKMPAAVASLAKTVSTIQLTGDYEGAKELLGKYVKKNEKGEFELTGSVAVPAATAKARFAEAGIKSLCLDYEVSGMEKTEIEKRAQKEADAGGHKGPVIEKYEGE